MDCEQMGKLLASLRRERGMTQRQTAQTLHVSAQAVSKWERGIGCPDVALLRALAGLYGVPVERLLDGDLAPNDLETGNMKRLKFYVCPSCGNLLTAAGRAELTCCGRTLEELTARAPDEHHQIRLETVEDEWYLKADHPMEKGHFIRFVAWAGYDRLTLVRLYPEQAGEVLLPRMHEGKLYVCCSRDGLFEIPV